MTSHKFYWVFLHVLLIGLWTLGISLKIFAVPVPGLRKFGALQDTIPGSRHSWRMVERGISTGYGYGVNALSLPEGTYSPIFVQANLGFGLHRADLKSSTKARFEFLLQPQFDLVLLRTPVQTTLHTEFGLGAGLQEMIPITKTLYPFIQIVVGPHYFSTKTIEQHRGFLFSDHVAAGFYWFYKSRTALHGEYLARHLSNGNIFLPNHGINTFNFMLGVSRFFF